MKLFLKDHLSIIILYLFTFISLPTIIDKLDGFENHYIYFYFLSSILLIGLLSARYLFRKKMYIQLQKIKLDKDNLLIYQPSSIIEKMYAEQMKLIYSLLLEQDEKHQSFLDEQQLLISHAVHQIKTPISVIQLIVQANETKNTDSLEAWYKIKTESDKINFSLNQLLSYSRSTKLISDLKIESFSLKKLVQEVVNDLKDYFIEQEVFPNIEIDKSVVLYSDRKWIGVAIYQILNNAVKYSFTNSTVNIKFQNNELSISNKGETIPKGDMNRIFNLFYTGSKGREKSESTGIGLYLVKKILLTLNYSFQLTSSNNETVFIINFGESIKRTLN